jgi:hypothetical protein
MRESVMGVKRGWGATGEGLLEVLFPVAVVPIFGQLVVQRPSACTLLLVTPNNHFFFKKNVAACYTK